MAYPIQHSHIHALSTLFHDIITLAMLLPHEQYFSLGFLIKHVTCVASFLHSMCYLSELSQSPYLITIKYWSQKLRLSSTEHPHYKFK